MIHWPNTITERFLLGWRLKIKNNPKNPQCWISEGSWALQPTYSLAGTGAGAQHHSFAPQSCCVSPQAASPKPFPQLLHKGI